MILYDTNPGPAKLRLFGGLWLPLALIVLALWLWWRGAAPIAPLVLIGAGVTISVIGWLRPTWIRPLWVAILTIAFPIGWVVSHLLLAIIYFLLMTPIALVMRLCGRRPLELAAEPERTTYWRPRTGSLPRARYFRQY